MFTTINSNFIRQKCLILLDIHPCNSSKASNEIYIAVIVNKASKFFELYIATYSLSNNLQWELAFVPPPPPKKKTIYRKCSMVDDCFQIQLKTWYSCCCIQLRNQLWLIINGRTLLIGPQNQKVNNLQYYHYYYDYDYYSSCCCLLIGNVKSSIDICQKLSENPSKKRELYKRE